MIGVELVKDKKLKLLQPRQPKRFATRRRGTARSSAYEASTAT